jgi:uncharacterized RDD family membrane protein YckC
MDDRGDLSPADPLAGRAARRPSPGYAGAPVPPGASSPWRRPAVPAPSREELAGLGRRTLAALVDAVFVGGLAVLGLLVLLGSGVFGGGNGAGGAIVAALTFVVGYAAIALLYAPAALVWLRGQTLGKLVVGIRVVRADRRAIGFWWAVYREVVVKGLLLGVAASLTGGLAYLGNALYALADGRRRMLHDLLVESYVVRA